MGYFIIFTDKLLAWEAAFFSILQRSKYHIL